MIEAPSPASSPAQLWSKTGRVVWLSVLLGLAVPFLPGLDALHWLPDDAMTLVPKAFRPAPPDAIEVEAPAEIDDRVLVGIGAGVRAGAADEDEALVGARPTGATADGGVDAGAEDEDAAVDEEEEGLVVESEVKLPEPPTPRETSLGVPLYPIEDPQHVLRRFFTSLERVERGSPDAIARVVHYGDSLITGDYVTQTVRRLMQKRFGDAGHGFVLAGRPSPWYRRDNLELHTSDDWEINRITRPPIKDGAYGLGGVTVHTTRRGQWVTMNPAPEEGGDLGATVAKMQVHYLAQPGGGAFEMDVDDGPPVKVGTETDEPASRVAEILVPDGAHTFKLRTLGAGEVRLFGVVFERMGPGVVYDSLGLDGSRAKLLRRFNPEHWYQQLRQRRPDLVILHYGTNESQAARMSSKRYRADLQEIVGHLRAALPGVSCLLVGPMDRAEPDESGKLVTRPVVKRIVAVQREVAYAQGCAFWNTWAAMGGEGSMARWYRMKPKLAGGDLTHPTRRGADRIGAMLFVALMDGYAHHVSARIGESMIQMAP
ncbi:MAG: SGNH/GDSL hydrolase family protein [Myxococcales bacterium]|nr:SGNH/GDSL hydrolase family protein [Myxococcales bacterium]